MHCIYITVMYITRLSAKDTDGVMKLVIGSLATL